jgi:hypothetical protein
MLLLLLSFPKAVVAPSRPAELKHCLQLTLIQCCTMSKVTPNTMLPMQHQERSVTFHELHIRKISLLDMSCIYELHIYTACISRWLASCPNIYCIRVYVLLAVVL